jgi:hypothetical protein
MEKLCDAIALSKAFRPKQLETKKKKEEKKFTGKIDFGKFITIFKIKNQT